jgi:hypothetical protein
MRLLSGRVDAPHLAHPRRRIRLLGSVHLVASC